MYVAEMYDYEHKNGIEIEAEEIRGLQLVANDSLARKEGRKPVSKGNAMKVYRQLKSGRRFYGYYNRYGGWRKYWQDFEDDERFEASQETRRLLAERRQREAERYRRFEDQKVLERRVKPILEKVLIEAETPEEVAGIWSVARKLNLKLREGD